MYLSIYSFFPVLPCFFYGFNGESSEKFYYAFNEKTYLVPKKNTLLVKYTESTNRQDAEQRLESLSPDAKLNWRNSHVVEITTPTSESGNKLQSILKVEENVYTCQPFYISEDGLDMGVTDEILVKFLPGVNQEQQDALHEKFKTKIIKTTRIYQLLRVSKGADALT